MYLTSLDHKFKFIGVSETWLNASSHTDMYCLDDYKFHCNNRKTKEVAVLEFMFINHCNAVYDSK